MNNFFRVDGKFYMITGYFVDCLFLNLLWFAFSIPIITIGASTAAAYHAADKAIIRSESSVWKEFWFAFRDNFKQSTLIWLLTLVTEVILFADSRIMKLQYTEGITTHHFYWGFMAAMAFVFIWFISCCAYMTKFNGSLKLVLRNSLLCFTRSLKDSVMIILAILTALLIVWCYFRLIIVVPAFLLTTIAWFMNRIYKICLGAEALDSEEKGGL